MRCSVTALLFMIVSVSNQQKDLPVSHLKSLIGHIARSVMILENCVYDELSVVFVTDGFMRKLHQDFFQDPTSTDVITFPLDDSSGELYICPKTAIRYAEQHGKAPYEELTLYLVHGLLHLLGYDDIDPKCRKVMRKLEKKHMNHLMKRELILHPKRSNTTS